MEDRSPEIITEMMEARGYSITERESDKMLAVNEAEHQILIIFIEEPKLNINTVKDLVAILQENELDHAIVVYNDSITSSARKTIESIEDVTIETFLRTELQYNITQHRLQPLFNKCTGDEAKEIKDKWGTKIPVMLKTDPIARFYNYSRGDIIRVTRKNGFIAYRVVR